MLLTLLTAICLADPAPDPQAEPTPIDDSGEEADETIEVVDDLEVLRRRREVEQNLNSMGYSKRRRKGSTTIFTAPEPWGPTVILHDDGWYRLKRRPVNFSCPGSAKPSDCKASKYLWCLLNPFLCIRTGGQVVSKAKLNARKNRVIAGIDPSVDRLEDAIARHALDGSVHGELPATMDVIWDDDAYTYGQRRAQLLDLWVTRTTTAWGHTARAAIEVYMSEVVQTSEHPFRTFEVQQATQACACGRDLAQQLDGQ